LMTLMLRGRTERSAEGSMKVPFHKDDPLKLMQLFIHLQPNERKRNFQFPL
jgi:hypothetical protein